MLKTVNGKQVEMTQKEIFKFNASLPTADEVFLKIKKEKCKEIDTATAKAITDLVGSYINQRNLTAKSVQLTLKETRGTITEDETVQLNTLNDLFAQVETLRVTGNDKEAQIMATATQEELEAKCLELGV